MTASNPSYPRQAAGSDRGSRGPAAACAGPGRPCRRTRRDRTGPGDDLGRHGCFPLQEIAPQDGFRGLAPRPPSRGLAPQRAIGMAPQRPQAVAASIRTSARIEPAPRGLSHGRRQGREVGGRQSEIIELPVVELMQLARCSPVSELLVEARQNSRGPSRPRH